MHSPILAALILLAAPGQPQRFPGYQPKRSPDGLADLPRPALLAEAGRLPAPEVEQLGALLAALARYQVQAGADPGRWSEGNPLLGAAPVQYHPSTPARMVSEVGARIEQVVRSAEPAALRAALRAAAVATDHVVYGQISVSHADVMGSGRFFYASAPQPTVIWWTPPAPPPGPRHPVVELVHPARSEHAYRLRSALGSLPNSGYGLGGVAFALAPQGAPGTRPLYACPAGLILDEGCEGGVSLGGVFTAAAPGLLPLLCFRRSAGAGGADQVCTVSRARGEALVGYRLRHALGWVLPP